MKILNRTMIPLLFFVVTLTSCASIQKSIDMRSLKDIVKDIQKDFRPGSPEDLRYLINTFSLEAYSRPVFMDQIKVDPLDRWEIDHPLGKDLIMEKISFPSLIQHKNGNDRAVFYVYRNREWKGRDVILWVPGMAVSDLAFLFIKHFFKEELKRDYDVVFYVPPFHLERTEEGKKNGDGLFTANVERNIRIFLDTVRELRTISEYLYGKGVRSIGGWGGSIGSTMLLLTSQIIELDHLCIMIPVLDWETVFLNKTYMNGVMSSLNEKGFDEELLKEAYGLINPMRYRLNVTPDRMHILFADYDRLTPPKRIMDYAEKNGITKIISYKRSHATILLTRKLYKDCGHFLDSLKRNSPLSN